MKILIDMNLSPSWVIFFESNNIESFHWINIGKQDAEDIEIMNYSRQNNFIVFTHDLDFGILLANMNFESPSVIQIRTQNIMPSIIGNNILKVLNQFRNELKKGALITIDKNKNRARILPLKI